MRWVESQLPGIAGKALQTDADEEQDQDHEPDFDDDDPTVALLPFQVATGHKSA
jgi:hypothetical protein